MKSLVTAILCALLAACDSKEPVGRYQVSLDANNLIRTDTVTGRVWVWHRDEPAHWAQLGAAAP